LQRRGDANCIIALAGNKSDMDRVVEKDEASAFAEENGILYMETSAKTGQNIKELFLAIARRLPKNVPETGSTTATGGAFPLAQPGPDAMGGCCSRS